VRYLIQKEFLWLMYVFITCLIFIFNVKSLIKEGAEYSMMGILFSLIIPLVLVLYSFKFILRLDDKIGLKKLKKDLFLIFIFWGSIYMHVIFGVCIYSIYNSDFSNFSGLFGALLIFIGGFFIEKYMISRGRKLEC
jgi:uncharacterized membrane protein YbhN (UPF0104 family)